MDNRSAPSSFDNKFCIIFKTISIFVEYATPKILVYSRFQQMTNGVDFIHFPEWSIRDLNCTDFEYSLGLNFPSNKKKGNPLDFD